MPGPGSLENYRSKNDKKKDNEWDVLGFENESQVPIARRGFDAPGGLFNLGAPVTKWGGGFERSPRYTQYKSGDEWGPAGSDPNKIYEIQQALEAAGYLDNYRAYYWDQDTAKAFRVVLTEANRNGIPWQEALNRGIEGAAISGAAGGGKMGNYQLPVFTVQDSGDLRDVFKQVAQATIGHYVPDEEVDSMVLSYQQMQIEKQRQQFGLSRQQGEAQEAGQMGVGPETVIQDVPSAGDWARRWYEGAHPWQAGATKGAEAIQSALAFLRGGGPQ